MSSPTTSTSRSASGTSWPPRSAPPRSWPGTACSGRPGPTPARLLHVLRDVADGEALRLDPPVQVDHHVHHALAVQLGRAAEVTEDDVTGAEPVGGGLVLHVGDLH